MLRLRPYKKSDAIEIIEWIENEYMFRQWSANLFDSYPITPEILNQKYRERESKQDFWEMTAYDEKGLLGHLFMFFTDEKKKIVRFGFVIINNMWRNQGIGKNMVKQAVKYAFEFLDVEKITLGVFENNPGAHKCYLSVGFLDFITEPLICNINGEPWKGIEMELTRERAGF